jgi:hypothetical protein
MRHDIPGFSYTNYLGYTRYPAGWISVSGRSVFGFCCWICSRLPNLVTRYSAGYRYFKWPQANFLNQTIELLLWVRTVTRRAYFEYGIRITYKIRHLWIPAFGVFHKVRAMSRKSAGAGSHIGKISAVPGTSGCTPTKNIDGEPFWPCHLL